MNNDNLIELLEQHRGELQANLQYVVNNELGMETDIWMGHTIGKHEFDYNVFYSYDGTGELVATVYPVVNGQIVTGCDIQLDVSQITLPILETAEG